MSIPVFRPAIKRREMDAVLSCLITDSIGPGPLSKKLITETAKYLNCYNGKAFREYSRAISVALGCLKLSPGDRVILSPLAPAAYVQAMQALSIKPVYADVNEGECVISPEGIEKILKYEPKAIITDTTLGFVPDMEELLKFGLPLIEDISQGLGGNTGEKKVGSYGDYVIIAMEQENIVTSGGGALLFGRDKQQNIAINNKCEGLPEDVYLSDMNAALALVQFDSMENNIQKRKNIAGIYARAVEKTKHKIFSQSGEGENIFFSFPVFLSTGSGEVVKYAAKKGIQTKAAFENSALSYLQMEEITAPVAESIILRTILFPLYPAIGKKNLELLARVISTLP